MHIVRSIICARVKKYTFQSVTQYPLKDAPITMHIKLPILTYKWSNSYALWVPIKVHKWANLLAQSSELFYFFAPPLSMFYGFLSSPLVLLVMDSWATSAFACFKKTKEVFCAFKSAISRFVHIFPLSLTCVGDHCNLYLLFSSFICKSIN